MEGLVNRVNSAILRDHDLCFPALRCYRGMNNVVTGILQTNRYPRELKKAEGKENECMVLCLSAKAHLGLCVTVEGPEEDLVTDALVVFDVEDFCKTNLPWWVSLELDSRREENEEIGLVNASFYSN